MSVLTMPENLAALSSSLRGICLTAASPGYDKARAIWNALADKRPAVIVQCSGTADVIDAVRFARKNNLLIAVRGGGHNVAGNATCDDGMVIDLSRMNAVRVDPVARRAWAGGGATLGDVDRETQAFGLAAPLGIVSQTGIAGLTLCGGLGWLRRKYGLSCDALVSADVVTADGGFTTASASQNSDLFWGLRGGGGNFGIVTSFEYQLHPVGPAVTLCAPFYALDHGADIVRRWRDFVADAPDEFSSNLTIWSVPPAPTFPPELHGKAVVIPSGVHAGDLDAAAKYIQPLRELGKPLLDLSGPWPYTAVQSAFDPFFAKSERLNYWKSLYLDRLDDKAIDRIVARAAERPSPWSLIDIWQLGGAMARTRPEDTALGARDTPYLLSIDTSWTDPGKTQTSIAWTRDFWTEMRPFSRDRVYLNFPGQGEEGETLLRASYGDANYERLVDLKTKYDPENLFRLNQNIRPRSWTPSSSSSAMSPAL
jgi:FAD/FMN-containing dehydrogenase